MFLCERDSNYVVNGKAMTEEPWKILSRVKRWELMGSFFFGRGSEEVYL